MAKKKTNRQSEDHKPPKSHHEIPRQTIDDDASEKLDTLKSLNAMLLKETVERRHQVDSLTQINGSLESEFSRCKSDNVTLQSELSGLTERALMFEIEKGLVSRFVAVQVNEMAEVSRGERVAMEEKIGSLEREMSRVLEEKIAIEKAKNKKEIEVTSLNSRLDTLVTQIGEEKFALSNVCKERDGIRAQLDDQKQYEKGLRLKLAEAEMRETEVSEKSQKIKVDYDGLVKEKKLIEQKVDLILTEKDSLEMGLVESNHLVNDLKRDIQKIMNEKMKIEDDKDMQEKKINDLHLSVYKLNELVSNLKEVEKQLLMKVADFEKKCIVDSEKQKQMSIEIDVLVKEQQEFKVSVQNLAYERSLVSKDLNEALKMIEHQKLTIDQIVKEKTKMEEQSGKFKNTITTLEKSNRVQIDKIKQLETEIIHHKAEMNKTRANLDEEKLKLKNSTEKISKMEKGIEETRKKLSKMTTNTEKLDAEKNDLAKLIAETRKQHDDAKAKLRSSEAKTNQILKILKTTNSICNSKQDVDQQTESGDDIKDYAKQVEAIKKAFKEKESIVEELKKQLDSLKVFAEKANDGKNFWTKVSSATTILAAASLAFIARGY